MKIMTEVKRIENIPSLLFYEDMSVNKPLVLIVHGFNNDKYEGTKLAMKLAQKDFAVLCIDIEKHGERYDGFMDKIDSDVAFGNVLFKILENTSYDLERVIKAVGSHRAVDTRKVGLIGISHGANVCNYFISKHDMVSCVSILGSPNFVKLLSYSMEKNSEEGYTTSEEKELLAYVTKLNPFDRLKTCNTPLLLINGSKDDNVPYSFSESLYIEVADSEVVDFILEDEFHYVSRTMEEKAIEWTMHHMNKV